MKKIFLHSVFSFFCLTSFAQTYNADSALKVIKFQKDSMIRALMHADSLRVEKQFAEQIKMTKAKGVLIYPLLNGGDFSGVVPVKNPTEIPDPTIDYKLLFELTITNPDSIAKEINIGLTEIARVINLHIASGIPQKKIIPVIVVHAGALKAITTNQYYKEHYKMDNPNLKLIDDLKSIGTQFIACGQAMFYFDIKKESLLPFVKVSLTAQTVLSSYQLKGFVLYKN